MPDNYLELLGKYRAMDEKTPQNEVIPEKETLNYARMREFLDHNGITIETFDTLFKVKTAMDILKAGGTKGEQEMLKIISDGQSYLTKIGEPELIERENLEMFSSTAQKELMRRNEPDKLPILQEAYRAYNTVRQLAKRQLTLKKKMGEEREKQKVSVEKGITDSVAGVIEDVKKHYKSMKPGEKAMAVGGIILGAILLLKSENKYVEKLKDLLWTTAKIAGVGVGANYIYKLFTGKTAVDAITDWSTNTVGNEKFWTETYKTDAEKAAVLQKSMVYLGNRDFLDLTKKYRDAKASGQTEIKVPGVMDNDMSPKEIFAAIDLFFSRYPMQKVEPKYRNAKPPMLWSTVVAAEMTEDGRIKVEGDLLERTVTGVREIGIRGWNGFWVTEAGFGVMRSLYLWARGAEPSQVELKEGIDKLRKQLEHEVAGEAEVPAFIDGEIGGLNAEWAKNYKDMLAKGRWDSKEPKVKFLEVPGDSIYIMSESKLDATTGANDRAVGDMLKNALGQAENFLKAKYPEAADSLYKFVDYNEIRGVRVCQNSTFKLFIRMPVKGSPEYSRKSARVEGGAAPVAGREVFGLNDRIQYARLEEWDKERLRIRFKLDVSQTSEIDDICRWYTDEYKTKGLSRREVIRIMLEDDKVMEKALSQAPFDQKLKDGAALLASRIDEVEEIEQDAADSFDVSLLGNLYPPNWFKDPSEANKMLVKYMRSNMGYKIRLAIMGDGGARGYFNKIDPKRYSSKSYEGWLDDLRNKDLINVLIGDYKKTCESYVSDFEKGKLKLDKP